MNHSNIGMNHALSFPITVLNWLEALRSGKFAESRGEYLCEYIDGEWRWTPFGVLCEACRPAGIVNPQHDGGRVVVYVSQTEPHKRFAPEVVIDLAGLATPCGDFVLPLPDGSVRKFCMREIAKQGITFAEIAEIIESNPEGLFRPGVVIEKSRVGSETRFDLDSRLMAKLCSLPR